MTKNGEQVTSLYLCPWSLRDPLCQSQSLPYLDGLAARDGYKFALMTSENPKFALDARETAEQKKRLAARGIYWYPVSYHQGLSLRGKALDFYQTVVTGLKICRRHHPQIIHSRSSLPTAAATAIARLSRTPFLYDADSLLSEEYVDIRHWTRGSAGFRVLAASEAAARRRARQIIVLTDALRGDYLDEFRVAAPVSVIPCCVDADKFAFNERFRAARRGELGLRGEKLFVYVGKAGSWYLLEETFDFFKTVLDSIPDAKLLVVTQDSPDLFHGLARGREIAENSYFIKTAASGEVPEWLSAADVGLAFIKMLASKRGSSPIKVAEYLAAGLPVVMTDRIGDCSRLIAENRLGAIVAETNAENYAAAVRELNRIWANDAPGALAARCREAAEDNFSLHKVGVARYLEIYRKMLSSN